MKKSERNLLIVAAIGGVVLLSRRGESTAATLTALAGAQVKPYGALMGAHLVQKSPGQPAAVRASWFAGTTRGGTLVNWNYRLVARLKWFNFTTGLYVEHDTRVLNVPSIFGTLNNILVGTFSMPTAPEGAWSVFLDLLAAQDNGAGQPGSTYQIVATSEHLNAINLTGAL